MTAGEKLAEIIKPGQRILMLGVGSELRQDDFAGMYLTKLLEPYTDGKNITVVHGSTAPENCTGVIRRFSPDVIIVFDAAQMGLAPGDSMIIDPETITGMTFSTHMLPLPVMLSYIEAECECITVYVGIEPVSTGQGIGMDKRVSDGVKVLAEEMIALLCQKCC